VTGARGASVEVLPDGEASARRGAELIAQAAADAIGQRGSFALALSGGRAPWRMVELLADFPIDWDNTEVFQVDERIAPEGDSDRNLTELVRHAPATALGRLRPMPVNADDLEAAAARYAEELPKRIDLVHLGLGPDGHTASLVPDDPVLEVDDRMVALTANPYQGRRRMTLTYPALAAARKVFWLITGEEKRGPLGKLLDGDPSIPAGRVETTDALVITDIASGNSASDS
jgi:6-phosphogluconolactonase